MFDKSLEQSNNFQNYRGICQSANVETDFPSDDNKSWEQMTIEMLS